MDSQETVDYRLLRQRQQEERFRARGATWKPSGKACTLQFVFDNEPKRPVEAKGINQPNTTHLKSTKVGKHVTTSVSTQPMAGLASQSKERTKNIKPVNTDVLDAGLPLQSDGERLELPAPSRPAARPRKPLKLKVVAELPQDHPPMKKPRVKDSRIAKQSSIAGKDPMVYEIDATASPLSDLTGPAATSKPAQKRKKKEIVKATLDPPLSSPESPGPDEEVATVAPPIPRSVKPRRPKKVERTVKTRDRYEDTEKESILPKKRAKPAVHDEETEEDMELARNARASKVEFVAASVSKLSDGRNARSSKKRRVLVDEAAQQWSMPTTQSTFRKTTIHFGLPLGGPR